MGSERNQKESGTLSIPARQATQRYRLVAQVISGPQAHEPFTDNNQQAHEFEVKP